MPDPIVDAKTMRVIRGCLDMEPLGSSVSCRVNGIQLRFSYTHLAKDGDEVVLAGRLKDDVFEVDAFRDLTTGVVRPTDSEPSLFGNWGVILTILGVVCAMVVLAFSHEMPVCGTVFLLASCTPFIIPGIYLIRQGQHLRDAIQAVRSLNDRTEQ